MRVGRPLVVTIAGSDPTGGAGLQGDLKVFQAHGAEGAAVVAALTVQNANGVRAAHAVEPSLVAAQLSALMDQAVPAAGKTGMLCSAGVVRAVAAVLRARPLGHLVVDPVLAATSGGSLVEGLEAYLEALREDLFPLADVVTPNLPEAATLLRRPAVPPADVEEAARSLLGIGCRAVLLKGGHAGGPAVDVLATAKGVKRFTLPRIATPHGHGSGCALSASLAVRLARGEPLEEAVEGAKAYVHRALAAAGPLGGGRGPVRHDVPA